MKKQKWYETAGLILLGILMLPVVLVGFVIDRLKGKPAEKKEDGEKPSGYLINGRMVTRDEYMDQLPRYKYRYQEPETPLPDEEFFARILEVECIQYHSRTDRTNGVSGRELVVGEDPRATEEVLTFLREHPIREVFYGDWHSKGCDMNHWKLCFIFREPGLNRCIKGYGWGTEDTEHWFRGLMRCLPRALSKAEEADRKIQLRMLERDLEKMKRSEELP